MFFIGLLMASTTAIAFAAAYFSVYGLANTFSGVFWSVVVMGASLEAGKLVAASYLYRYWDKTHLVMKSYLIAGVAALMLLTSTGIFGYLSAGYQQDVLPLQQKNQQISLLEDEKARTLARKKQIDDLLAGGPAVTNLNTGKNGAIDNNAARTLRETTKSREALVKQYKGEQEQVTKHVTDLDSQLLTLKQDVIKVEAHIGPITYIAKAFGWPADDATKYLIFIIIFAFDPMAVALTLAVNNALRIREEELEEKKKVVETVIVPVEQVVEVPSLLAEPIVDQPPVEVETIDAPPVVEEQPQPDPEPPVVQEEPEIEPVQVPVEEPPVVDVPVAEPEPEVVVEPQPVVEQPAFNDQRRVRPYPSNWNGLDADVSGAKMRELINHHKFLKARRDNGETLSTEDAWALSAIEGVLKRNGINIYL